MPRRNKACDNCRRRRCKCDETLPQCLMCQRTGRVCSGPLQGPLIVLVGQHRASQDTRTGRQRPERQQSIPRFQSSQAITLQPFIERYVTFYDAKGDGHPRNTWMFPFLSTQASRRHKSLELSIQAAATAFAAVESQNPRLMQKSIQIYGQALSHHIHSVSVLTSPGDPHTSNVSASIMLASYEGISVPACFKTYKSHLDGISKMLLLSKELISADDSFNHLFFDARALSVSCSCLLLCLCDLDVLCSSSRHS